MIAKREKNLGKFKTVESFYSVQGEGTFCGTPMIFIRFAGCNLSCEFCDTDHKVKFVYTYDEMYKSIITMVESRGCNRVLFTGGEPTLQLFTDIGVKLIKSLHKRGIELFMETNGTIVDGYEVVHLFKWITLSPKKYPTAIQRYNEVKIVVTEDALPLMKYYELDDCPKYLQPNNNENIEQVIKIIKRFPDKWKLSVQMHKLVGIQ